MSPCTYGGDRHHGETDSGWYSGQFAGWIDWGRRCTFVARADFFLIFLATEVVTFIILVGELDSVVPPPERVECVGSIGLWEIDEPYHSC